MMKQIFFAVFLSIFLVSHAVVHAEDNFITIITSNPQLHSEPSRGAPLIKADNSLFGQSFNIVDQRGPFFEILIPGIGKAWIENKKELTLQNIPSSYIMAQRMPDSRLIKKALIVNRPLRKNIETDIKYYDNPELTGEHLEKISTFEIRFIFGESDKSSLIGRTDRMIKDNSDFVLLGWVSKKHIVEWNNLIGIEFEKNNYNKRIKCELGKIFNSERHLKANSDPMFTEGKSDKYIPYYANRFPVLGNKEDYYKIAYIGDAFGKKSNIYNSEEVKKEKSKIMRVIQNNEVQIAILIDATKDMEPHVQALKDATTQFLNTYRSEKNDLNPAIAVAVYRDYSSKERIFEIKSDFTSDRNIILNAVESIEVSEIPMDDGGTRAVFYGIDHALNKLSWKDSASGEKYILLLGDHGNHEQYDKYPQYQQYSAEKIGQKLKDMAITLFALQFNISSGIMKKYNIMFENQIQTIKQNNQGRGGLKKVFSRSSENIFQGLQDLMSDFFNTKEALVEIRNTGTVRPNSTSASTMNDMYKGIFSQKMLERHGINPETFDAVQICDIGYVKRKNACGHNQLYEKVLMKKNEIESLKVQMQQLSDSIKFYDPSTANEFKKIVFKLVKVLTGDDIAPDETIAQFIQKKSGIPVNTPFLHKSLNQLATDVQNRSNRIAYRKYLQERIVCLEGVTKENELIFDEKDWEPEDQVFLYRNTGEVIRYFFSLEQPLPERGKIKLRNSQKQYAWVPLEYLP